ncbi:MAG: AraC family transcriptional regulator, partial [Firmicutes bacterium]|nr:AraC family transcriptional regulator [Bacillota bacterium]
EGERASGREWFARFWPKGDYGCFMVVLIRREQSEIGESGLSGKIADFTKPDPRQILDRLLRRAAFSRVVALKPDTDAVILAFGSRGDTEFVSGALKEALLRAETEHDLLFTAVCSAPAASADELPAAYRQAYFLLESGDVSLKGAKVLVAEEAARPKETAYFPLGVEQALNSALAQNKPELWRSILKDVVQTNKARGAKDFSRLALMFTAAVNRMMDSLDMGAAEIFDGEKNLYQELSAGADPDEFYDRACRVCSVLSNEMAVAQKRLSPAAVEKMEEFINANYQNDISLFDLAAHLNLSKNYVSTLFKNATGMNFKDYVNQVRYEAARALFDKYPSMKVKDAAEKTGCSADILTRLFIRYAGMPPREYQNRKR